MSLKDAMPKVELVQSILTWATDNIAPQPWCPSWLKRVLGVGRTFGAWQEKPGEEWKDRRQ